MMSIPETLSVRQGMVVVIGSINADYIVRVARRPDPGETVSDGVLEVHPGGKGANQAVAVARCGARVKLVARVGDDRIGATRLAELHAEGVDAGSVRVTADTATGAAFITVTPDGQNAITVAPGANSALTSQDIDAEAEILQDVDVLVAQLEVPIETVMHAVGIAGPDVTVVLNCAPFQRLPGALLSRLDVLVANEIEGAALCGWPVDSVDDALRAAREIRQLGPSAVVLTLGAAGAVVVGPDCETSVATPAADVVDTTGAGDAFVGALAACLTTGMHLEPATRFAVAVGSATTETVGALPRISGELLELFGMV